MSATAAVFLSIAVQGLPEDTLTIRMANTSAVGSYSYTTATTGVSFAAAIPVPSSGKFLLVVPDSTNTLPLRLTESTNSLGIRLSSRDASFLSVVGGSTYHLYTTGADEVVCRTVVY